MKLFYVHTHDIWVCTQSVDFEWTRTEAPLHAAGLQFRAHLPGEPHLDGRLDLCGHGGHHRWAQSDPAMDDECDLPVQGASSRAKMQLEAVSHPS